MYLWNPVTLKFSSPELENRFIAQASQIRMKVDFLGFFAATLLGFFALEKLKLLWILMTLVLAPSFGIAAMFWKEKYLKWRNFMILTFLAGTSIHCYLREKSLPPPDSVKEIIMLRFVRSPGMVICFGYLAFRFLFRTQMLFNVFWLVEYRIWAKAFCSHCNGSNKAVDGVIEELGKYDSSLISILSMGPYEVLPEPPQICARVVMFNITLVGILIPSFLVYISEVAARAAFLARISSWEAKYRIMCYRNACVSSSIWVLMGASILLWSTC